MTNSNTTNTHATLAAQIRGLRPADFLMVDSQERFEWQCLRQALGMAAGGKSWRDLEQFEADGFEALVALDGKTEASRVALEIAQDSV